MSASGLNRLLKLFGAEDGGACYGVELSCSPSSTRISPARLSSRDGISSSANRSTNSSWPPEHSLLWQPPRLGETSIGDLDDHTLLKIIGEIYRVSFASCVDPPKIKLVSFRWFRLDNVPQTSTVSFHFEAAVLNTAFFEANRVLYTPILRSGIKVLDFTGCIRLKGSDVAQILSRCPDVTELNISNCFNIGPMAFDNLQLARLRVLVLGNLRVNMPPFLQAVAQAAPQLRELVVAGCLSFDQAAVDVVISRFPELSLLEMSLTTAASSSWQPPARLEVVRADLPLQLETSQQPPSIHSLHPKLYGGVKSRSSSVFPVQTCLARLRQTGSRSWFSFLVHLVQRHRASLAVLTDPHPLTTLTYDSEVLQFLVDHGACDPTVWSSLPSSIQRPTNPVIQALAQFG